MRLAFDIEAVNTFIDHPESAIILAISGIPAFLMVQAFKVFSDLASAVLAVIIIAFFVCFKVESL